MTIQVQVSIPSLKEEFTVSATCQPCADKAVAALKEIEEVANEVGLTPAYHMLRGFSTDIATITNRGGDQMNGARAYDCN